MRICALFCLSLLVYLLQGCASVDKKLPILGNAIVQGNDTIYPVIKSFSFISQDSLIVTEKTFDNKIYVADFIFLSCPTICPKMTSELSKVYQVYKNNSNVLFLSHTVDPEHDSINLLKQYSDQLGVDSKKWFFVTGVKDSIYSIAIQSYFTTAYSDSTEPGGYLHGGGILLVDKYKHIRGVYDGTAEKETDRLKSDIQILLKEQF